MALPPSSTHGVLCTYQSTDTRRLLSSTPPAWPSTPFSSTAQLKAALAANGINADVEVAGVTTGADIPPPAFTPPQGGGEKKKGLGAGALAGIIVGSVGECAAVP